MKKNIYAQTGTNTDSRYAVTIAEAINYAGVKRSTLWRAMKEGKLKYSQPHKSNGSGPNAKKRLIRTADLRRWIDEGIVETTDVRDV